MIIEWLDRMEHNLETNDACFVSNALALLGYLDVYTCTGITCVECKERARKIIEDIRRQVCTTTENVTTGLIQGLMDSLDYQYEQPSHCFVADVLKSVDERFEHVCDGLCDNKTPMQCDNAVSNVLNSLRDRVCNKTECCTCKSKQAINEETSDIQPIINQKSTQDKPVDKVVDKTVEEVDKVVENDNVDHPTHYKVHKHECIDEMVAVFGVEAVKHFCMCNAWKYRYRSSAKNGEEDLAKADWYIEKLIELDKEEKGVFWE